MYRKHFGCIIKDCLGKHCARGYCQRHYIQLKTHGKILIRTIFDKNNFIDKGTHFEVELYNQKNDIICVALVSKKDKELVAGRKWCVGANNAVISSNPQRIYLHHFLMGKKDGLEIDHINRNPLDNRKENLRFVTHRENCLNREAGKPQWKKDKNRWRVREKIFGKEKHLGYFDNYEEAKKVKDISILESLKGTRLWHNKSPELALI